MWGLKHDREDWFEDTDQPQNKTRVLIQVRGGVVGFIASNNPDVEIVVVDYDNYQGDNDHRGLVGITAPDKVVEKFSTIYEGNNPDNKIIRSILKRNEL